MNNKLILLSAFFLVTFSLSAQKKITTSQLTGAEKNVITTAVPFMTIAPDARAAGMGDVGAATSPDANSLHWNVGKMPFIKKNMGFSLSYSPWLSKLVPDMSLAYLSGYKKISKEQTVAASLRYFDMGSIQFTDEIGNDLNMYNPKEFAFEGSYSQKLSPEMGIGVTLKVIYSNLVGPSVGGTNSDAKGLSVGGDVGYYYTKDVSWFQTNSNISAGATITNLGSKMAYSSGDQKNFIPTTLRIGGAYKLHLDEFNTISLAADMSKLLVPTPPEYSKDENGDIIYDQNGDPTIENGKDPNRSLLTGVLGSFMDAPGGIQEEMRELMLSTGLEYWYNNLFAVRTGYFYEHTSKGGRKYFTMGVGFRYNVFGVDFAYLVPQKQNHPLAETIRFSLLFNFGGEAYLDSVNDAN